MLVIYIYDIYIYIEREPGGSNGKKKAFLQCRIPRFDPWVGRIPWRRDCLPTLVFLPREFHGQKNLEGPSP